MRTYSELIRIPSYNERFAYLDLNGEVGTDTFGHDRYLNQKFYQSKQWRDIRRFCIARDLGLDMAFPDYPIAGQILLHHMNPINAAELRHGSLSLLDPENLVCVSKNTHNAIHYGKLESLPQPWTPRQPGDTKLW